MVIDFSLFGVQAHWKLWMVTFDRIEQAFYFFFMEILMENDF